MIKKRLFANLHFKEIFASSSSTFVFKVFGLVLSYLVILFITNTYGAETYGRYSLVVILTQVIAVFFTLGFPTLVLKLTSDNRHFDDTPITNFLSKIIQMEVIVGLILSVVIYYFSDDIAKYLFDDVEYGLYLKILSFLIVPAMFNEIFLAVFKGKKEFHTHNTLLFILPPVLFFASFAILKNFIESDIVVFSSFAIAMTAIFFIELKFLFASIIKSVKSLFSFKELLKESLPMLYSGFLIYLLGWTDAFMIEGILSSYEVGIYNASFKIASLGFIVITTINVVIAPKIVELFSKKENTALHKTIVSSTRMIAVLSLPIVLALIIFSKAILSFFGEEFIAGQLALILISSGVLFSAFCGNVDQILNMTNNQIILRNIVIVSFLLNIILNYFFITYYGINGAAIASLITNVVLNGACVYYIKKRLGFYTFI